MKSFELEYGVTCLTCVGRVHAPRCNNVRFSQTGLRGQVFDQIRNVKSRWMWKIMGRWWQTTTP